MPRPGSWTYGDNYQNWGLVETNSSLPGAPNELSIYVTEAYKSQFAKEPDPERGVYVSESDPDTPELVNRLRRYTIRIDGFVSVRAPLSGGTLVTRPLIIEGDRLEINFSTSAAGRIPVEIQDLESKPMPGFALEDCHPHFGDQLDRIVTWDKRPDLAALAGKPIRMLIELKDADLYSFRFAAEQ